MAFETLKAMIKVAKDQRFVDTYEKRVRQAADFIQDEMIRHLGGSQRSELLWDLDWVR